MNKIVILIYTFSKYNKFATFFSMTVKRNVIKRIRKYLEFEIIKEGVFNMKCCLIDIYEKGFY